MSISISLDLADLTSASSTLPQLYHIRQSWRSSPIEDISSLISDQLSKLDMKIAPEARIAVTAGSRGIANIAAILQSCVAFLIKRGAKPFVVPAMGSHGGATAEGQRSVLEQLGITEAAVGCPILSSMEVIKVGALEDGTPVFVDKHAAEADGILVVNRVKAHTSFRAEIESGLAKMCAVGLGKRQGAEVVHSRGVKGLQTQLVPMARLSVEKCEVLGGLAIIEDANEQTATLVAVPPRDIGGAGEAALLRQSKDLLPKLPFEELDVLVVDEIGKNYSGTGMDTNVIGRLRINNEPELPSPRIAVIVALDVSDASHGNANGIGLADLVPASLIQKVDWRTTWTNSLTSGLIGLRKGAMPIALPSRKDAIATAVKVCGVPENSVRLARIPNTLHLQDIFVSAALLPLVEGNSQLELLGPVEWKGLD